MKSISLGTPGDDDFEESSVEFLTKLNGLSDDNFAEFDDGAEVFKTPGNSCKKCKIDEPFKGPIIHYKPYSNDTNGRF